MVFIGIFLSLIACLLIGTSFIIKKVALKRIQNGLRACDGGHNYLNDKLWWIGMISMTFGELCNFSAFYFAPAILVTPLNSITLLISSILSVVILRENINIVGWLGCLVTIISSCILCLSVPESSFPSDIIILKSMITSLRSSIFYIVIIITIITLMWINRIQRCYKSCSTYKMFIQLCICSLFGSITIASCKCLGVLITELRNGTPFFEIALDKFTWIILLSLMCSIILQVDYLNRTLDNYEASIVSTIYFALFTISVIITSGVVLQEFNNLQLYQIISIVLCIVNLMIGVFILQFFKDMNFEKTHNKYIITNKNDSEV